MSGDRDADLIIVGGGCAGLSLASKLARLADRHRTIIIEPRKSYHHDRTWCFWGKRDHQHAHLIAHRWFAWRFTTGAYAATQVSADGTSYQCLPSKHFYDDAIGVIEQSDQVALELGVIVEGVADCSTYVDVHTSNGTLRSRWVVDTRPPSNRADNHALMNQLFVGAEVQTSQDCFDPSATGLMEDMSVDDLGFRSAKTMVRFLSDDCRFSDFVACRQCVAESSIST